MNYRKNEVLDRSEDCSGYLDRSFGSSVRNIFSSPDSHHDSPRKYRQMRRHHNRSLNYSPTPAPELD